MKDKREELRALIGSLNRAERELESEASSYDEIVSDAFDRVRTCVDAYNEEATAVANFLCEVHDKAEAANNQAMADSNLTKKEWETTTQGKRYQKWLSTLEKIADRYQTELDIEEPTPLDFEYINNDDDERIPLELTGDVCPECGEFVESDDIHVIDVMSLKDKKFCSRGCALLFASKSLGVFVKKAK
jgi:hypothetical protein